MFLTLEKPETDDFGRIFFTPLQNVWTYLCIFLYFRTFQAFKISTPPPSQKKKCIFLPPSVDQFEFFQWVKGGGGKWRVSGLKDEGVGRLKDEGVGGLKDEGVD